MKFWNFLSKFIILMPLVLMGGCATSTDYRTSTVQFLYSDKKKASETVQIPILSLPIKVGIAFVPETGQYQASDGRRLLPTLSSLTENDKMSLMEEIGGQLRKYEFVKSVVQIPSDYMFTDGGFDNLERVRTTFNVDVITLVSFNQSQFVDKDISAIAYLTVIGAFLVPGEKNETHTVLDAVCYHIPSRKMILGATGSSDIKSRATPLNILDQVREDSLEGFRQANKNLSVNFDQQLALLGSKICNSTGGFEIMCEPGYAGIGSLKRGAICSIEPLKADKVLVKKSERILYLKKGERILKEYKVSLGKNPVGDKEREGDCRTPEGIYILDWRKKNSQFYKAIHISYPNRYDVRAARSKGVSPGGMVMIHGVPNYFNWTKWYFRDRDWTNGCIAVSNAEMDEIWAYVPDGTIIEIQP